MTTKLTTKNQVDIWYGTSDDSSNLIIGVENIGTSSLFFFDGQTLTKLDIEDGINHISLDIQSESWGFILFNETQNSTIIHILDSEDEMDEDTEELTRNSGLGGAVGGKTGKWGRGIKFPPAPKRPAPKATAGTGRRSLSQTSSIVINNLSQLTK